MTEPILRATGPDGEIYYDPSEDALFMLMEDMRSPGSTLRVERLEADRNDEWATVKVNELSLYDFESSGHIVYTSSFREIHDFLTRWAFESWDR